MVSVTDIARKAGVAYSTASIALRGVGRVAPETRARVLAAAEQLGYVPNAAAAILANQRKVGRAGHRGMNVAFCGKSSEWRSDVSDGVRIGTASFGYGLESAEVRDEKVRILLNRLWNRGVEGLILSPTTFWVEDEWQDVGLERFSMVKIGRVLPSMPMAMVRVSVVEMMMGALRAVYARGYQSVLCVAIQTPSTLDDDIRLGATLAYQERYLKRGQRLRSVVLNFGSGQSEARERLRTEIQKFKPDAVIGFPWSWAFTIKDIGYRIPEEIGFAALPVPHEQFEGLSVAGMDARREEQGRVAVHRLHQLILSGQRGLPETYDQTLVEPVWKDGATLPQRG